MERGRRRRVDGRKDRSKLAYVKRFFWVFFQQTYLLPQSILEVTFCLSSLNSSLGRVPERSWERHSISSHISLWTCFTCTVLLAQTYRYTVLHSDTHIHIQKACFCLLFYHKELLPYASPLPQCGGHLLHQGHLCRHHDLLISVVTYTNA